MSGICGILHFNQKPISEKEINDFTNSIQHKGNDATGVWYKNNIALGHKMLWTTPESLYEHQPQHSQDYSVTLTADARIDNRQDLINQLRIKESDNYIYTDADLIIKAYQKWGVLSPKYLIGDFSFALWDEKEQLLFCARDRIGIKPFFYTFTNNSLFFSSEISPIFKTTSLEKKLNMTAFEDYLLSLSIDFESTFFENICRLPAASTMIVKNGKKQIQRYWTPYDLPDFNTRTSKQNSEEFFDLLQRATKAQLRSAYSTGISLSGGLDSSAVTYFASKLQSDQDMRAYSIRFGDLSCDESLYIDEVLKFTGINSSYISGDKIDYKHKYSINSYYEFLSEAPAFGFYLPMIPFMELLKKHKTRVLLTGHGGDHTTQGSEYYILDWMKKGRLIPAVKTLMQLEHPWGFFKSIVRPTIPNMLVAARNKLINKKTTPILNSGRSDISFKDINQLYPIKNAARRFDINAIMGARTSWLNDSGIYTNAGAYNLEVRHPFFDHRVVDFSFQIPSYQKFHPLQQKFFFANYSQEILPELVRTRNNKTSYTDMLKMQYSQNTFKQNINYTFLKQLGIVNDKAFDDIIGNCEICQKWNFLTIEKWLEKTDAKR